MLFFDPSRPNKYNSLKKLLIPHKMLYKGLNLSKKRYGQGDGSYVLAPELIRKDSAVLSYGIGDDPDGVSFEQSMDELGFNIFCYDPNGDSYKSILGLRNTSFEAEALNKENFKYHVAGLDDNGANHILKMDIEGHEYDWLTDFNLKLLADNFAQFTVEVHSLVEEIPEGWILEPQIEEAKKNPQKIPQFFEKLNKEFSLFHIHANNHAPRYVDFPDSLELTYINKRFEYSSEIDNRPYPILGLDEPNFEGREDYVLDWWVDLY